jgi:transcriptional regulator with XRE-family HTH domain
VLADEWQDIVTALAITVRDVRRLLGWSQQHLADQAVVSQGAISRLEAGHSGVPLHTVVVVLRTLAAGAVALNIPLSPTAAHLLAFAPALNGTFAAIQPPDPDLASIVDALEHIPRPDRPAFLRIVRAAAEALRKDDD